MDAVYTLVDIAPLSAWQICFYVCQQINECYSGRMVSVCPLLKVLKGEIVCKDQRADKLKYVFVLALFF